jgi:tetratricopeptide (TPR) repeat protein
LRSIDKATYNRGKRLLQLGGLAIENKDYDNAITIFSYVQATYSSEYNGYLAEKLKIGAKRQKIENTYPIDTSLINSIVEDYQELLTRTRRVDDQVDIKRQMARMEAFYLAKYNESIANLKSLISNARISLLLKAECKLELGDIYILIDEPWESALLYYQVEKDFEAASIGHEAKLRNAKLSYFKGDFELAQSHLDILKEATSREIANDALSLSLLIKDNLALDTSDAALKLYAFAELYEFQGNVNKSMEYLDSLIKTFRNHSLLDECYFKKGKIMLSKGRYEEALDYFKIVISDFPDDILADDAMYALANTYEFYLNKPDLAKATYKEILIKYPGSVFVVDARKRYRLLRGDKI